MTPLTPRDYQIKGIEFLKAHGRGCVWDEVGLGKSLQGLLAAETPVLVACPSYLLDQWKDSILAQFPDQTVLIARGTSYERAAKLKIAADWHIINIEMFRDHEFPLEYKTLLIDEAHHLRGRTSKQSHKALELAKRVEHVYQLTATPMKKGIEDLFMQLRLVAPYTFTSYSQFLDDWCIYDTDTYSTKILGVRDPEAFKAMIALYGIRRSYKDASVSLPDLIETVIKVDGSKEWVKRYKDLKDHYRLGGVYFSNAIQVFTVLRQLTACADKIDALKKLLDDAPNDDGAVIFTYYKETAEALSRMLKIPYIHGDVAPDRRAKIAKDNKLVVATIASLSEGVDLSDKSTVIYFEEDYVPGSMYQATGRVRRHRTNPAPVRCYYLHMANSLDERVHETQTDRTATVESILKDELNGDEVDAEAS